MTDYTQLANEAKARAEKATPGPWEAECGSNPLGDTGDYLPYADIYDAGGKGRIVASCAERADISAEADENNAQFIAHARTDVPAIADALLACQRERDQLLAHISELKRQVRGWPACEGCGLHGKVELKHVNLPNGSLYLYGLCLEMLNRKSPMLAEMKAERDRLAAEVGRLKGDGK